MTFHTDDSSGLKHIGELLPSNLVWVNGYCDTHGEYRALRRKGDTVEYCPDCKQSEVAKQQRDEAMAERKAHMFRISGVPKKFESSGLKNYPIDYPSQDIAVAILRGYLLNLRDNIRNGRNVIMTGGVGTGKTRMACAIANNAIAMMFSARYFTVADMLAEIKRAYSTDGMTEASQIYGMVHGFDILILDEIDLHRATATDMTLLFQVVNGRNLAMKPVVAISNQAPDELDQFVGDRIADRLRENALVVTCDWPSYRKAI